MTALPSFAAIVVAAGQGLRAGQPMPKQFAAWRGKPVVRHSVEAMLAAGASPVVVAIPASADDVARQALSGLTVTLVTGGETRQRSVALALEAIGPAERVLIHDAARPVLPRAVIERVLAALDKHSGAIPVLPMVDSLAFEKHGLMTQPADRSALRRVQTPQGFRTEAIRAAHRAWAGLPDAGDDAQVLRAAGEEVAMVEGDEALAKLTFAQDFAQAPAPVRVGTGYDVHRLEPGEELWLCGVRIEHDFGLAGHSDADVGLHAVVDALLGAIGAGDIGQHFPPSDPQWRGCRSARFVEHAMSLVHAAGYRVGNIDLTLICEAPKIGPHREAMQQALGALVQVDAGAVNVKATTTERLGFTGRGEGIAAQAAATLIRI
ncbi:bifunctional 2-C-methyl-D-erythritol 4-phosphate cytidylyltransferase/2-C-methyl-D-erythritol 2,4-cyclodiphosphate synthase [Parafrankia sp. BMG5.11]|uniref:bifunctional 2-C-methyl-D-erythritol 4-phosphate cytidylyltransferase/2-C-methyl-D-erythritol 2,4-cyclodiphosphate synthase n=1 Tax=Parafrankia sp. BMG5.11 TaxID=222540 RepID=UPI00103FB116|nr:bifunctional 2-C-methyl-D-erythritol 4-phosphate cytidylyltransferase/2-C-methyl-D-erythritol 2,4-cyclodiphosphate synthase [Parafrankia sp. BMG5.11]TCJ39231.1 bifunctional 2-C-methyl-D-erythritol 4-phosphate cytidylyltransferase/2-C-methyl-D-erythritol 2,4-cyclodiphosphate synthase [Parafrankia sp. BMG5.11]